MRREAAKMSAFSTAVTDTLRFQRARIPRSQRTSWPVVVAESTIVWVASFPVSREFAARECSQKIVAFEEQL